MAVTFVAASSQYLSRAVALLTALPMTLVCWYKPTTVTANSGCIFIGNSSGGTSANNYFGIYVDTTAKVRASQALNNASAAAISTTSLVAGTWYHLVAVFASTTSRSIYIDAGTPVNSATSMSVGSMAATAIGTGLTGAISSLCNGVIAYPAIYNSVLSAADIAALYNGGAGADLRIATSQDSTLQSFSRLAGNSPWLDSMTGVQWTTNGAPVNAADPFAIIDRSNLLVAA